MTIYTCPLDSQMLNLPTSIWAPPPCTYPNCLSWKTVAELVKNIIPSPNNGFGLCIDLSNGIRLVKVRTGGGLGRGDTEVKAQRHVGNKWETLPFDATLVDMIPEILGCLYLEQINNE